MRAHYVYRCYDAEGQLLYIGCTSNLTSRIAAHRRGDGTSKASRWLAVTMASFTTEGPYRGREVGREAERAAIQSEQPLFNYQERANEYQAAWMTRSAVARYLVDHGHLELALETACECWRETKEVNGVDPWCHPHLAVLEAWVAATFTEGRAA